ncbi:MAG: hypothetical protein WCA35_20225 [Kovacikia sp.]
MTSNSKIENYSFLNFGVSGSSFNRTLSLVRRTLLTGLLIGLIWLPGLSLKPALAMPISGVAISGEVASQNLASASPEADRMTALIACLPKQLSQPNFKRALSEMGNDQLERAFNLKANPKLSQAEVELANCLNRQAS